MADEESQAERDAARVKRAEARDERERAARVAREEEALDRLEERERDRQRLVLREALRPHIKDELARMDAENDEQQEQGK